MTDRNATARAGILMGLGAYTFWGVMPLYFKAIGHVPAVEIVSHRILWSLLLLAALATVWKRWAAIRKALTTPRVTMILLATTFLIGLNWLVFIYAVVSGHVLEGSLGYYLNPLVNVLLGVFLLKEKLTGFQKGAVLLAATGVAVLAAGAGDALWISLTLAASFALYGFIRKVAPVDSVEGLAIETALLAPVALGWLIWLRQTNELGMGRFGTDVDILLALGGAVTAIPLLMFTAAARRLPYSMLGFLQYIAPSLQFLLAVLAFGEPLTTPHVICFAAIWTALAIFSLDGWRSAARARAARA